MKSFTELLPLFPNNQTILETAMMIFDDIQAGKKMMVSVSGGSDSDILVDLYERIGYEPGQVIYVFFNTGIETGATIRQLDHLENRYEIRIKRYKAKVPVPVAVKREGVPFLSKLVSMYIGRLQRHGFQWEDAPLDALLQRYPQCKAALRWWCDDWGEGSSFNISRHAGLKEFIMLNPPPPISDKCCNHAKKSVAYELETQFDADVSVVGVRRAEGGERAVAYKCCLTPAGGHIAQFRPIFFWSDADKKEYEDFCGVVHSDCYTVYGFKRTGCACCPFGSGFEHELEVIKEYEPKLYKAACSIFGESYEYTRKYRVFKESWKREKRRGGQIDLFDRWDEM